MNVTSHFSWSTMLLLLLGWAIYWLSAVRFAKKAAKAAGTTPPTWDDYFHCDPEGFWIAVFALAAAYWVLPLLGNVWPEAAKFIGATADSPMNSAVAFFGGIVFPLIVDTFSKRFARMVGD